MPSLRTLLILGRTSNLPTVWSNCLAAWWLGGGGDGKKLVPLMIGATLSYLGGMYLNDAFDADFDAEYKTDRPIPAREVSAGTVWKMGFGLLAGGVICLFLAGLTTGILGILLAGCILVYDVVHKAISFSPVLMAGCRFFLYLAAGSTGESGVTGWVMWCAIALAGYIIGLSYIARKESRTGPLQFWPCLFLAMPIVLAGVMNTNAHLQNALWIGALLALWVIRSLRFTFAPGEKNIGRTVSGLLAGIVWVDLLAVADVPRELALLFGGLFLLSLLFQKFIPAT